MKAHVTAGREIRYLPSDQVRVELGTHMAWVTRTKGTVVITDDGVPDGRLVPPELVAAAELIVAHTQGVRLARARWGATRGEATTHGPQGLTNRGVLTAVLVDQPTAAALERRLPVLTFAELTLTDHGIMLADDMPVAPGSYALPDGKVVHVDAPQRKEDPMRRDQAVLYDPSTSDEVIREVLDETAARATGVHMRAARAATSPAAAQKHKASMRQAWKLKGDFSLTREQMVEHILRTQEDLSRLEKG
ncbi:hypothetical protein [Nocardiopsis prasina]|uniref:hypothetical protein n=1 Tax=Nocardiopsis prasina TaxID=2015 RepID=UPI00034B5C40|nr:hypothetical protein [Nocardiopsis prasina]